VAAAKLKVAIVSPERTLFDGPAEMVVVPAWDGELGILRGHAPMLALLGKGTLRVTDGQAECRFAVDGGFLQVADDTVIVLSERASAAPA
jgi:F-type H+-transporting ATPase subunit epsilon